MSSLYTKEKNNNGEKVQDLCRELIGHGKLYMKREGKDNYNFLCNVSSIQTNKGDKEE